MRTTRLLDRIHGCLLGGLICDAMGAPRGGEANTSQTPEQFGGSRNFQEGGHGMTRCIKQS